MGRNEEGIEESGLIRSDSAEADCAYMHRPDYISSHNSIQSSKIAPYIASGLLEYRSMLLEAAEQAHLDRRSTVKASEREKPTCNRIAFKKFQTATIDSRRHLKEVSVLYAAFGEGEVQWSSTNASRWRALDFNAKFTRCLPGIAPVLPGAYSRVTCHSTMFSVARELQPFFYKL
jgi:hypothetical protein